MRGLSLRALTALVLALLLWASAFAGIRVGLTAYSAVNMAGLRFVVASLVLLLYAGVTHVRIPARKDWPLLGVVGFLSVTVYHMALNQGELTVSAGAASLIINLAPVFAVVLAGVFLHDQIGLRGWVGIAISFIGAGLIGLGEGKDFQIDSGALLILIAALASGTCLILQKKLLERYRAFEVTAYTMWFGTIFLLLFSHGLVQEIVTAPWDVTLTVVYLGIFPAALAGLIWNIVLARLPATFAASFLYLIPVLAIVVAWLWLSETPTWLSLVGGALALAGVVMVSRRKPVVTNQTDPTSGIQKDCHRQSFQPNELGK